MTSHGGKSKVRALLDAGYRRLGSSLLIGFVASILGGLALLVFVCGGRAYPEQQEVSEFVERFPRVDDEERTQALTKFLRRLAPDDNREQLNRGIGFDDQMVDRYAKTRDRTILPAYAEALKFSIGSASYRVCETFERIWKLDDYGRTLGTDPSAQYLAKNCDGAWGDPLELTRPEKSP